MYGILLSACTYVYSYIHSPLFWNRKTGNSSEKEGFRMTLIKTAKSQRAALQIFNFFFLEEEKIKLKGR